MVFFYTMEKEQYRSVIRFLYLDGKTCEEIKAKLNDVYGNLSPSIGTVKYWFNQFQRGRISVFHDSRPADVITDEIVKKIHDMILADRRMKMHEVAKAAGVSHKTAINILHDKLGVRKLLARWVPRLLTVDNKWTRLSISKQCLDLFKRNPQEFLRRVVTVDEIWIQYYTFETTQQSKHRTFSDKSASKKAKSVLSAGKIMATIFWDSKGIILLEFLEKGSTITGQYYSELLDRFDEKLKGTRTHLAKEKVLFHHNAPAYSSGVFTAKSHELHYELLPHPPYSPDLAPCDFFLFPDMKTWLADKTFSLNEVIVETEIHFEQFDKSYFLEGLKKWQERWEKCIALRGDYIEK